MMLFCFASEQTSGVHAEIMNNRAAIFVKNIYSSLKCFHNAQVTSFSIRSGENKAGLLRDSA